jgi:hypothetical protein
MRVGPGENFFFDNLARGSAKNVYIKWERLAVVE